MARITKAVLKSNIEMYLNIQAQIKALTEEADSIKAFLKEQTENTEDRTLIVDEHKVTLTECKRSSVDAKALAEAHPKIAEKFTKVTTYDVLKVK